MTPGSRWTPGPRRSWSGPRARTSPVTPPSVPVMPSGPIAPAPAPRPPAAPEYRTPTELFDSFAAAFAAGNVDRIADCYTAPAYVVTNARTVVFATRTEIVDGFTSARSQYRTSGLTSVGYEMGPETLLSGDLVEVTVRWCHRGQAAGPDDSYRYLLRRVDGSFRIHVAMVMDARPEPGRTASVPAARQSPDARRPVRRT
ncbi:hypothetical protein EV383_3774 [Pseudonocardia sediminis]|uniref:Ketosteroid isomerase-like protein n=1 Tax=Pseudonocardia sediminis TaxID=1397368 RepID=A0A4Q7UYJ0_PSEST|nr:DUF4440 domain-containing protein [Pseudonocardia sediminis]RZT86875.1 hypothetical protein EV383_3774 [Pseudonocardia sediminis]